jgi:hypothetical protein
MHTRIASILTAAVVCVLMSAAAASASTAFINPSGRIRQVSSEKITFTAGEAVIRCAMTITGTLFEGAEGTLTESPNIAVNPRIGRLARPTVSECTGGMPVYLEGGEKYEYWHEEHSFEWLTYTLHHEFLIEQGLFFKCLYDMALVERYHKTSRETGWLEIVATRVLSQTELVVLGCRSLTMTGRFQLISETSSEAPEFTLRP